MITGIAVVVCLALLATKLLADSSDHKPALRISGFLIWLIIPLLILFIVSITVRVAEIVPELPLIF